MEEEAVGRTGVVDEEALRPDPQQRVELDARQRRLRSHRDEPADDVLGILRDDPRLASHEPRGVEGGRDEPREPRGGGGRAGVVHAVGSRRREEGSRAARRDGAGAQPRRRSPDTRKRAHTSASGDGKNGTLFTAVDSSLVLRPSLPQRLDQRRVPRLLRRQVPVPHQEIDDHHRAVGLELVRARHGLHEPGNVE